jgi:hypothetical protein
MKYNPEVGAHFGRLRIIAILPKVGDQRFIKCQCDCGKLVVSRVPYVMSGHTKSCGCLSRETASSRSRTHGLRSTPEFAIWNMMIQRCSNPKNIGYKWYGARGIMVCERWRKFAAFYSDVGPRPSPTHTLDRINNDGNYEPGNVRWATQKEQSRNRRSTRFISAFGKTLPLIEWAELTGTSYRSLSWRLKRGMPPEKALTMTPQEARHQRLLSAWVTRKARVRT